MQTAATFDFLRYVTLLRLAGPIFDKESRAASRRRHNYALRAGYMAILTVVVASAWSYFVGAQKANPAFTASRVGDMAYYITMRLVWFQFVAAQLIAAVILSASIGSEVRMGTLSVLMTTPITSFHIVLGKLLSGLLQVALLLAVSLPMLAILRVFGSVPWGPVLGCFCITLTAMILAGTVGLLLSTYYPHTFDAVSAGVIVYLLFLVGLPVAATALVWTGVFSEPVTQSVLDLASPFRALSTSFPWSWQAPPKGPGYFFFWPIHCLIVIGVAAGLLYVAARRIRRAALAGAFSGTDDSRQSPSAQGASAIWGDARDSLLRRKRTNIIIAVVALAVCVLTVIVQKRARPVVSAMYDVAWCLWMLALLRLAVAVAGGITREKESGAWPVLLTTPLDDEQILRHKVMTGLRRDAVLLISALAIQICFLLCASASPKVLSVGLCLLSAAAAVFFIAAAGLYFGVRLRTTTNAVVATLGAYLCLNYVLCGHLNPLFGWLMWKLIASGTARSAHLMLLGFGMGASTFVLDTALGMFLIRRALRIMRYHIF